jgi:hypothetical protein
MKMSERHEGLASEALELIAQKPLSPVATSRLDTALLALLLAEKIQIRGESMPDGVYDRIAGLLAFAQAEIEDHRGNDNTHRAPPGMQRHHAARPRSRGARILRIEDRAPSPPVTTPGEQ